MSNLIKVEISDELVVEVTPHVEHEWLLSSKDVAEGYGLSDSSLRSAKSRHSDELEEGKHYIVKEISSVANCNSREKHLKSNVVMWTKKGVIRLGFLIKTPLAKQFRDWAEDFIIQKQDEVKAPAVPMTYIEALQAHLESVKQLEEANKVITLQAPKVEIYDSIMATDSLVYPEKAHKFCVSHPMVG